MFDGIEAHRPTDRVRAWLAASEYTLAERATAWIVAAAVILLILRVAWCAG